MLKKVCAFLVSICIIMGMSANAAGQTLIIDSIIYEGSLITVTGHTNVGSGKSISMRVMKAGITTDDFDSLVVIQETVSNDDGSYLFQFYMPETDGQYSVFVRSNNSDTVPKDFGFLSNVSRYETVKKIKNASDVNSLALIFGNESDKAALINIGLVFGKSDNMNDILTILFNNSNFKTLSEDSLRKDYNKALGISKINALSNISGIKDAAMYLSMEFDEVIYKDITNDTLLSWINQYLYNRKAEDYFTSFEQVDTAYSQAVALYKINNARYGALEDLMIKYCSVLGLSDNSYYKKYCDMENSDKSSVNIKVVTALDSSVAVTLKQFADILKNAVNEVANIPKRDTGGGGSQKGTKVALSGSDTLPGYASDPVANNKNDFSDLIGFDWAKESIDALAAKKIISGYSNAVFAPNDSVTREQFVKMIVLAIGGLDDKAKCSFEDVDKEGWSYPYIASAFELRIISGTGNDNFGSGNPITREDMSVVICKAAEVKGINLKKVRDYRQFSDNGLISYYAADSIQKLFEAEKINGISESFFAPKDFLTRAEAAKAVYEVLVK